MQGWDRAPNISQICARSWVQNNPDWQIVLLDRHSILEWIEIGDVLPGLETNYISTSDIYRLLLLSKFGGVWADATLFCNRPLDDWLDTPFFVFDRPMQDRMIASWFIKADRDSFMVNRWLAETISYWKGRIRSTNQYDLDKGWIHRLFAKCYADDEDFRDAWDSVEKISAEVGTKQARGKGPSYFTPYAKSFREELTEDIKQVIDSKIHPVYKLTYKVGPTWRNRTPGTYHPEDEILNIEFRAGGSIDYLLRTAGE
jgi:hypothetical protein